MKRRRFIKYLLQAGALLSCYFFKGAGAIPASRSPGATVPLADLNLPWSFAEVEFSKMIKTRRGLKPSIFPGYVIRLPDEISQRLGLKNNLYAISRICPHEGCPIKYYKDRSEVPYPPEFLDLKEFPNPLLICTCHQSVFDPAQGGKVVSGPSPRPPWSFDFVIEKGSIIIKELEPGGEQWG
jgi:Rieske Fe-S protein